MDITNLNAARQAEISAEESERLTEQRAKELEALVAEEKLPSGFYFDNDSLMFELENTDPEKPSSPIFICSKLDVTACTCDDVNDNHGRLLEFVDVNGCKKQWAMPMELLAGDGTQYRAILLSMGLRIAPGSKARNLLTTYIQSSTPKARVKCVPQTGWHLPCFILPNETIGNSENQRIVLQAASPNFPDYAIGGTLAEWKIHVSTLCMGNSRLIFSVSSAFASPLLALFRMENRGFHFRGPSSIGKTTALSVAASVWGNKDYVQTWRATTNGIEAVAAGHNDALLCLDELAQVDPFVAGDVAYMLANGTGKNRANRQGYSRKRASWRLIFLSTGEISLANHMTEAGKKARGGQEVRIVDIPADTQRFGLFENLHGHQNGSAFAQALSRACFSYHGTASREFLKHLVEKKQDIDPLMKTCSDDLLRLLQASEIDGQVHRVAKHFALVAAAGELATGMGITGWGEGDAFDAAKACFLDWLKARGGSGSQEEQAVLAQVRRFFEQNGESRFTPWDAHSEYKTVNRAGYRKPDENDEVAFFVFPETFKSDIANGFDSGFVVKVCAKHGLLRLGTKGEATRSERLPGMQQNRRCYRFTAKVLGEEEASTC